MIRHTVAFRLRPAPGSPDEADFLRAARVQTTIPGGRQVEWQRQVSPKNPYTFGFAMVFASQADYDACNVHPEHVRFVETRWKPEVDPFLEADFVAFEPA